MHSKTNRWLAATVAVLTVTVVGQFVWQQTRPEPTTGLRYPVQRVLNTVTGETRPALLLGETLRVQGTKCNVAGRPVPLSGVTSWVSLDPPGSIYETSRGSTVRPVGCVTRTFLNPIPPQVVERTRVILAESDDGPDCVTWQVSGRETPTDPMILPVVWTTEPFDICQ